MKKEIIKMINVLKKEINLNLILVKIIKMYINFQIVNFLYKKQKYVIF